jgi:ketosteroid isomerase-like protein
VLLIKAQPAHPDPVLYATIRQQDSLLFAAFNGRNIKELSKFFSTELELYQDNTGVRNYQETMAAFADLFTKEYVLTRELVPGSLEVYPIKGFGAIETGSHRFSHIENGKPESAVFKFTHVWEKTAEGWKIKRLITYDH